MSEANGDKGISVVVQRTARAGKEREYEAWLHGVIGAASAFPGHLGAHVLEPEAGSRRYVLLFRFDTMDRLLAWEQSEERNRWLSKVDELTEGSGTVQRITGMETWFSIPSKGPVVPPPRWKMAVVSFLVAFPLIQGLNVALVPHLAGLPPLLRGAVVGAVMVLCMTYAAMPLVTRLLVRWLYPQA
ncbi:putative membrane protein [Minicystis rosea]|nr:putative membrane protein [Minicystis rosea]